MSFILISIQKSGTDMLSQALGIYKGPYLQIDGMVDPKDVHPNDYIIGELKKDWPRGIARSHMHFDMAYLDIIKEKEAKVVFCFRDPRDTIVSWFYWIKSRQAAGWFDLSGYSNDLDTMWDILSVSKFHFSRFLGWHDAKNIFQVRYEDMINRRSWVFESLSKFLGIMSSYDMMVGINPKTSTTFRKGLIGEWKTHFTDEMVEYFWEECGEIMERLGYDDERQLA